MPWTPGTRAGRELSSGNGGVGDRSEAGMLWVPAWHRRGPGDWRDVPRLVRYRGDAVEDSRPLERLVDLRETLLELTFEVPLEDEVVGADDERKAGDRAKAVGELEGRCALGCEVEVYVGMHRGHGIEKTRPPPI